VTNCVEFWKQVGTNEGSVLNNSETLAVDVKLVRYSQ
jgi:hypothetical protein